ncbi:hypothetical protein [Paenibacillus vulneris]|uniref:Uncharacterized protein n=1 Tax=Paenibacillus vulneris TaxID=1133364 RepID=A0ABW3UYL5_9BACL
MRYDLIKEAAYWMQVEEVAHEPAVQRYARRRYERIMRLLRPRLVSI